MVKGTAQTLPERWGRWGRWDSLCYVTGQRPDRPTRVIWPKAGLLDNSKAGATIDHTPLLCKVRPCIKPEQKAGRRPNHPFTLPIHPLHALTACHLNLLLPA